MDVHLHAGDAGGRISALYRQLREAIVAGRLRSGERLPATRVLAVDLGVARATVTAAYERLVAEGLAEGRTGAGTFVADAVRPLQTHRVRRPARLAPAPPEAEVAPSAPLPRPLRYDLRHGRPDDALFPLREWRPIHVAEASRTDVMRNDQDPAGDPALRAAVARHLGRSRGITVDPDEVLVTRGTAQALDLIARTLLRPGDPVAMESPAYPDAVLAFRTARARPVGVPVDAEGLVVDRLPPRAALVYCTPSHQAPVGPVLSLPRRVALLEWARHTGAWIVEDDYDTEYRWARLTLDPLKSLDADGRVLYLGSVSKTLSPRLRVGWIVAPPPLLAAVVAVKQVTDPFAERPVQRALARFIDEGRLALHVRRTAAVYGARRAVVLRCVAAELPRSRSRPGRRGSTSRSARRPTPTGSTPSPGPARRRAWPCGACGSRPSCSTGTPTTGSSSASAGSRRPRSPPRSPPSRRNGLVDSRWSGPSARPLGALASTV